MADEVERKFIVDEKYHHLFLDSAPESYLEQMYLQKSPTVRVTYQKVYGLEYGWIAVKGAPREGGLVRSEWEYEIPPSAAQAMIAEFNSPKIVKNRHNIIVPGSGVPNNSWEVDVLYLDKGRHLVVAEFEGPTIEEVQNVKLPEWVGREVTGDHRFSMVTIAQPGGLETAFQLAYN